MIKLIKTEFDDEIENLAKTASKIVLLEWAIATAEHILGYFENKYNNDMLVLALDKAKLFFSGDTTISEIRKEAFSVHAYAKNIAEKDIVASLTARCVGQAISTAHVKTHAVYAAEYALAVIRELNVIGRDEKILLERKWQLENLKLFLER